MVIIKKHTKSPSVARLRGSLTTIYLSVCHPLTEVMDVQHYRPYEALLLGSHPSLVVFKENLDCT